MRILVIDDYDPFRAFLTDVLNDAGYEVSEARNGRDGLRLFRESPTDLVITDVLMPEKDGIEIITELRRDFPKVKIIAVSGGGSYSADGYLQMAKLLGSARTLAKPVRSELLLEVVHDVLSEK
jgi:DNA-binding response OmpR family regulator